MLEFPWITEAFEVPDGRHDAIATLVFEEGRLPQPGEEGARLREELYRLGDLVEGPVILSAAFESRVELTISAGTNTLTHPFMVRRLGDELAFVDPPSGLALVFSDRRRRGDQYVHETGARLSRVHAQPIDTLPGKEFLRHMRPGAVLDRRGKHGIPISMWPNAQKIGPAIEAIDLVHERLGLDTSRILLADLQDPEFGMTLTLLEFILSGSDIGHILPGLVLGPGANSPDPSSWQPAKFRVPLIANFKDTGLVLWIEGLCDAYIHEDLISGFRVRQQSRWECDVRDSRFTKGTNLEAWIAKDWPPIALFAEQTSSLMTFTTPSNHPLEGDIDLLATDQSDQTTH